MDRSLMVGHPYQPMRCIVGSNFVQRTLGAAVLLATNVPARNDGPLTPMVVLRDASGRGEMTWILVALWAAVGCIAAAMIIAVVDEVRRTPSNVRRTGVGLALVTGFASLWLLVSPFSAAPAVTCEAPLLSLVELGGGVVSTNPACLDPMRLNAGIGILLALASPVLVLSTRGHRE